MKTHGLTYFTGAVKNFFGLIHGLEKSKYHFRADNPADFASFIIDLYSALLDSKGKGSFLNIMDGITGLEGEGPGASGKPVNSCAVIAGKDAVAVDTVAVKAAGLELNKTLTCVYGGSRGAGLSDLSKIKVSGNDFSDFTVKFKAPASRSGVSGWPFSSPLFKNMFIEKPVPLPDKCTLCYQCRTICPAEAISKSEDRNVPLYNYSRCIRCYCCMEICPEAAIELKKSFLQKITGY
jgi:Pyruvate/2-oxoacid:ferredoxin oxidoreductase delta subunit